FGGAMERSDQGRSGMTHHGKTDPQEKPPDSHPSPPFTGGDERFRLLFNQAAVGIGQLSLDGRVILANPGLYRMFGYEADEFLGMHFSHVTHSEDSPRLQ